MLRLIFFILQLVIVVGGALWLSSITEPMTIELFGQRYQPPVGLALLLLLIAVWILFQVYRLVKAFIDMPKVAKRMREETKHRRGLDAISRGLSALAAGDTKEASKQSKEAEKFLSGSPLTHLIGAQTALLEGDTHKAEDKFTAMLDDKQAAFMGLRGLINQAMKRGDREESIALLHQARGLRPKTFWVVDTLFRLEAARGNWATALEVVEQGRKQNLWPLDEVKSIIAALKTQLALVHQQEGDTQTALATAKAAVQLRPDFAPAQTAMVEITAANQGPEQAQRVLERAWKVGPHPLYTQAYIRNSNAQTPASILEAVTRLAESQPQNPLSVLELGRAQLANGDLLVARETLERAEAMEPSHEVYRALAALAEAEGGSHDEVLGYQQRAELFPRRDSWVCSTCLEQHAQWSAVCSSCESFNTMTWGTKIQRSNDSLALEQRMAGRIALLDAPQ